MFTVQFVAPLAFTYASAADDYCGTMGPHFPLPRGGVNPGQAVQQGIIIVSG